MKTKFVSLICAFVCCLSLTAQTDSVIAVVDYDFYHLDDTTQTYFPRKEAMRLYIGKNISHYTNHDRMLALLKSINSGTTASDFAAILKKDLQIGSLFTNKEDGKLTYIAPAGVNSYIIEETIPVITWDIKQETKDIQGYPCQKATTSFRGRNYEAWFCTQLPYNNGPWKLGGLPGLILEAYDVKKDVKFSFKGFSVSTDIPAFTIDRNFKQITAKEYQKYIDAMNKDTRAMIGAAKASGGNVLEGVPRSSSDPRKRIKVLNNPLEKTND